MPHIDKITSEDKELVEQIKREVHRQNVDNIARTNAYFSYYQAYPEMKWSFLAHMVSRNAGWNMCDLKSYWFEKAIHEEKRSFLYQTYEKANWLIFHDAYPQLLLYHYSTKKGRPMFHLLRFFHVSRFMEKEWNYFWKKRDQVRLLISLIINEQNVIQKPVIERPLYQKNIFQSLLFSFQDWFHYSCVLFPTLNGELFGASVNGFTSVDKRIDLGKRLSSILFDESLYPYVYDFATHTIHTGSRYDYEQYWRNRPRQSTPALRSVFPVLSHEIHEHKDWSEGRRVKRKWRSRHIRHQHPVQLTTWFSKKRRTLHRGLRYQSYLNRLFG